MYMDYVNLNPNYFIDLDASIPSKIVWEAFADQEDLETRQKVYDLYKTFKRDNADKYSVDDGGVMMPQCRCNEAGSFKKAVDSFTHGTVVGHPFSDVCVCDAKYGFCEGTMSVEALGWEIGSQQLVPKGKPANCYGVTQNGRVIFLSMSVVAVLIAIFAYRSSSNLVYDFHRLNFWNIVATWMFSVMFMIDDPHLIGYTRFLGIGIFVHNCAEWNFMIRLWYGVGLKTRQVMSWWAVTFLSLMTFLVMLLPLQFQLLFAGTMGAMLDVAFVMMALPLITLAKQNRVGTFLKGESRFSAIVFVLGYLAHFVALNYIFIAMGTGDVSVEAMGIFVLATLIQFFMLELFAYNQDHRAVCCGPYAASSYEMKEIENQEHKYMLIENTDATTTAHEDVVIRLATDGELATTDKSGSRAKNVEVYDASIYPDGLNERAKGCEECSCVLPLDCRKRFCRVQPIFVYLFVGFFVALSTNLQLFLTNPMAVDTKALGSGDCTTYYPIHANGAAPAWLEESISDTDSLFMQKFGKHMNDVIDKSVVVYGVIAANVLLTLLFTVISIQNGTCGRRLPCLHIAQPTSSQDNIEALGDDFSDRETADVELQAKPIR